ncbi:MAG: GNAT family N-acetyltransferase [Thiocapsa sp.]|nr:MAG: GNAT family N-acetyltransferase [Thiocapsa sp.]
MILKDKYRQLCLTEPSIPIFSRDWWLDAVAGADHWNVALVEQGDRIDAALPYVIIKYQGFILLAHPPLTQTLGPWLRESDAKYTKRLSQEKDLLEALIAGLPNFHYFSQNWHHARTNWLPFYWQGFSQTTRYTYRLLDISDEHLLWNGLQANIRTDIRKARDRFRLTIRTGVDIDDFLSLNLQVFQRQRKSLPYSKDLVRRLDRACHERNARRIFIAEDEAGRYHAGVYLIWDQNSAYYLMGGGDPALRNSGATSLCMWEAIRFAATVTKSFDFEGSMIEPVERFFRAFGAVQTPYFSVSKTPSRLLRVHRCIRSFLQKVR